MQVWTDQVIHAPSSRTARVVTIDDEYGARLQVELALATSEVLELVGEAPNGMRGAELVDELQPDLVVLDLSMPVMDGFEALPLLHTVCPPAVVVVRSNLDDPADRKRALDLGAAAYLPKFMPPDEMLRTLEQLARIHGKLRPPIQLHHLDLPSRQ